MDAVPDIPEPTAPPDAGPPARPAGLSSEVKLALSLWLIFHVVGVILTPATASPLIESIYRRIYSPYLVPLHMIHRYRFFAPEPGPSGLIRWSIARADGSRLKGEFPHRDITPRQLYHRHFMLAERSLSKADQEAWFRAYAKHLLHKHGGESISLQHVFHLLPTAAEIQEGHALTDPEFYDVEEIGTWTREELQSPSTPAPPATSDISGGDTP